MIPVKRESEPDQSIHYLLYANKAKENCIVTSPPPSKLGPPIAVQIVSIMMAVELHVQAHVLMGYAHGVGGLKRSRVDATPQCPCDQPKPDVHL